MINIETFVVDEQVAGLFFDFVHDPFHFDLPHVDGDTGRLSGGRACREAQYGRKQEGYQAFDLA